MDEIQLSRSFGEGQPPPPPAAPSSTPVISGITATAASTSVTISWTTDEPATSQLLFCSGTAMTANVPVDPTVVTSHSMRVSYLAPSTTYFYTVESKDAYGGTASSAQQSFNTSAN